MSRGRSAGAGLARRRVVVRMVSLPLPSSASACSRSRAISTLPSKAISLRGSAFFAEGFFDTLDFIANGLELRGRDILDVALGIGHVEKKHAVFWDPEIEHSGTAPLSAARQTLPGFAQATSAANDGPRFDALSEFGLEYAVGFIVGECREFGGEAGMLNKSEFRSVIHCITVSRRGFRVGIGGFWRA